MRFEAYYDQTLRNMEATVLELAHRVPQPQSVPFHGDGFVFRYVERTLHQALVQKLARCVSGLHAARLLLNAGFLQEQGALLRMLEEIQEDVTFLAHAAFSSHITPLHAAYLDAFFEEEFDAATSLASTQKRAMIPRQKIRAYIARIEGSGLDFSRGVELRRTISKTYSGYVHAASPHIMDMYGGDPPRFHVRGMRDTPRQMEHREDLWNYFYRGILAFALTAKAFGDESLFQQIRQFADKFAEHAPVGYGPDEVDE